MHPLDEPPALIRVIHKQQLFLFGDFEFVLFRRFIIVQGDDVLFESEGKKLMKLPLRFIARARLDVEF